MSIGVGSAMSGYRRNSSVNGPWMRVSYFIRWNTVFLKLISSKSSPGVTQYPYNELFRSWSSICTSVLNDYGTQIPEGKTA